jgi:UbiD family decarboxylase
LSRTDPRAGAHVLRALLAALRAEGELVEVDAEVDPRLEIAEIHRRVIESGGPALLFRRVKGADLPLVTNLFGTARRTELAFGRRPLDFVARAVRAAEELLPPTPGALWKERGLLGEALRVGSRRVAAAPVVEVVDQAPDATRLPALQQWPEDGGPFLTLPMVYTERPGARHESNLGIYRMQIFSARELGIHWQIGKGGGFHYHEAEARGEALPVTVFLGGPPALILAAAAPLPEGIPELLLASVLLGEKLPMATAPGAPHRLVANAEAALAGHVAPRERTPEGAFGDHYGYYSLVHD